MASIRRLERRAERITASPDHWRVFDALGDGRYRERSSGLELRAAELEALPDACILVERMDLAQGRP